MLENIILILIRMNIVTSIIASIILTIKYLLNRCNIPRTITFFLWIIIAFRLICPYTISSNISVFNMSNNSSPNLYTINNIENEDNVFINEEKNKNVEMINDSSIQGEETINILEIVGYIWVTGVALMIIYGFASYINLKKKVRFAVKTEEGIYETDELNSPCVIGILKTKIYLISRLTEKERYNVIMHEKMHIKRKDNLIKIFSYILLVIHWFNPLNWIMFKMFIDDIEMSCDEKVILSIGMENKKKYLESLLSIATKNRCIVPNTVAFGENITKRRVENMINFKKMPIAVIVLVVLICGTMAIACMTDKNEINVKYREVKDIEYDIEELILPVDKVTITSKFGSRIHPIVNQTIFHDGIDLKGDKGEDVYSVASGKVINVEYDTKKGYYIEIEHNLDEKMYSEYRHLLEINVSKDQIISQGDIIGKIGSTGYSTGPHLHFSLLNENREYINPLDYIDME